jgi:ABC-type ATPase involved in cell division
VRRGGGHPAGSPFCSSQVALARFRIQPTSVIEALEACEGTILCASHDRGIVEGVATHVYDVRDGAVQELLAQRK